jgi:hypothetical protein
MNRNSRTTWLFTLILVALMAAPAILAAQDLHPSRRPSPMGMARIDLDGTYVRVVYSRPYLRGRENIFGTEDSGALVPYGKIWRTGANEATEITLTGDVMFGDATLAAGTYSVFSTPGAGVWTVHFNSALGLSGTARYNPETEEYEKGYMAENDVLVIEAAPGTTEDETDQFTISFESADEGAEMIWRWATTEIRVPVKSAG